MAIGPIDIKTLKGSVSIAPPASTKPAATLPPIINATNALKSTFGSALKGMPATGASPIPPNRPKALIQRTAGNLLSPANPPVLKDPRLTSQVRATAHPDILVFPPHPVVTTVKT
jgi:hypothetical protein